MHGPTARIILSRIDVKDAFRQVLVDPVGAPVFGYAMGGYVVVDLRLHLGWRNSPGFWGLMASALEHVHTHPTFQDAAVSPRGAAAVEHVRLSPPLGGSVRSLRRDCRFVSGSGRYAGSRFFVRYCVDDGVLVEVQWWPDGRRCMRAVQSLASDDFRLLGVRGASDLPLLSARKISNWDTRLEVLGWLVDTEALMVTSPSSCVALSGVTSDSHLCFSETGVAASGFPRAHFVRCSSRVVFRASSVGFACDAAHRSR